MKLKQKTTTILEAEEGMLLRRKSDGWVIGDHYPLGYNYYEAGINLAEPKFEKPDDFEEIVKPDDYEEKPLVFHEKRLTRIAQLLEEEKKEFANRGLTATEMIKHKRFAPQWGVDIKEGAELKKKFKFAFGEKLYVVLQDHTVMAHYEPSINTAALYKEVTEDYTEEGEEYGTLENPIPYEGNMVLEEGKYYSQEGKTYLCTRDSINPLYHALSALVGQYVEVA